MKIVVALYLLTVFCAAYPSDLSEKHMKYQIELLLMDVDYGIQILQYANDKAQLDYKTEVENNFNEKKKKYMKMSDSTIDAVYAEVEDAKVEGKDAQICYDNSRENIRDISTEAGNNGFQCIKSGEESLKSKLIFIEELIESAHLLKEKLDQHNLDMLKPQIEETELRNQTTEDIKVLQNLQDDVKIAKNIASSMSETVVIETIICFNQVILDARKKMTNLQLDVFNCIGAN